MHQNVSTFGKGLQTLTTNMMKMVWVIACLATRASNSKDTFSCKSSFSYFIRFLTYNTFAVDDFDNILAKILNCFEMKV